MKYFWRLFSLSLFPFFLGCSSEPTKPEYRRVPVVSTVDLYEVLPNCFIAKNPQNADQPLGLIVKDEGSLYFVNAPYAPEDATNLLLFARNFFKPIEMILLLSNHESSLYNSVGVFKREGATVLAFEKTRALLKKQGREDHLPDKTFYISSIPVKFIHEEAVKAVYFGETLFADHVMYYFPNQKILYTGGTADVQIQNWSQTFAKLNAEKLAISHVVMSRDSYEGAEFLSRFGARQSASE